MKELLKSIILEQQEDADLLVSDTIPRKIEDEWIKTPDVLIISGIRRCGKSVLMQQIRNKMAERDFYFNFDDDRLLQFTVNDFVKLQECFFELFGEQHTYYFDEIQNIEGWETFVRRLHNGGNKVYVTGSNARMLSRELGTHLTGRYLMIELFPFSFSEYLAITNHAFTSRDLITTLGRSRLLAHFKDYLTIGGFPSYIQHRSVRYLSSLYQSIIYRDIITRNKLSNEKDIQELVYYLASNPAKRFTYSSIGKLIGVKHPETIKNYLSYIEQTFLIFQVMKYDPSLKIQMFNAKKVYFIDNAIVRRIGFSATDDTGHFLENLVYIELRRLQCEVYYHFGEKECDFVVREGIRITRAYQVSVSLHNQETRNREMAGLIDAMATYSLSEGYILTMEEKEEVITETGRNIHILPVWEWILSHQNGNLSAT